MSKGFLAGSILLTLIPATSSAQVESRRLMPGDRVLISSPQVPWLCVGRTVDDDGRIELPDIGRLAVATRTAKEVTDTLIGLFTDSRPVIEIKLLPLADGTIRISGAVGHPLEIRSRSGIELIALLRAAALSDVADADHLAVSRADGTFLSASSTDHFRLRGGDRVFVPILSGSTDVNVLGGVAVPSAIRFRKQMSLAQAIEAAGGLAPRGDGSKIVLMRHGEPIPLSLPEDTAFQVLPGETIQVGVRADRRYVVVQGAVAHPGLIEYSPGMTLTQAVDAAGGVLPVGNGFVTLQSGIGKRKKAVRLSLSFIKAVRIPDPVLQPDDVLEVDQRGSKG